MKYLKDWHNSTWGFGTFYDCAIFIFQQQRLKWYPKKGQKKEREQ